MGWVTEGEIDVWTDKVQKSKNPQEARRAETRIDGKNGLWLCMISGLVCRTISTGKQIRIAVAGASSHWPF